MPNSYKIRCAARQPGDIYTSQSMALQIERAYILSYSLGGSAYNL